MAEAGPERLKLTECFFDLLHFQREWTRSRRWTLLAQAAPVLLVLMCIVAVVVLGWAQSRTRLTAKYIVAGDAAIRDEDVHRADLFYRQALIFDADNPHARYGRALVAEARGDTAEAARAMAELTADGMAYTPAHLWQAERLLEQKGEMSAAARGETLRHLEQVVRKQPNIYRAHLALAQLYLQVAQLEPGLKHLELAAKGAPPLRLQVAKIYLATGQTDAAKSWAQAASRFYQTRLQRDVTDVDTRIKLAASLVIAQDFPAAATSLDEGLKLTGDERLRRELSVVHVFWSDQTVRKLGLANPQQLEHLAKAIDYDGNNPVAMMRLATLAVGDDATGLSEQATAMLERSLAAGTAPPMVHFILGSAAASAGDLAGARQHLEQARALDPNAAIVLNNLAWIVSRQRNADLEVARRLADEAVHLAEDNLHLRDTRGQILARLGLWEEALVDLEMALPEHRNDAETHAALALVYEKLGDNRMSEVHQRMSDRLKSAPATRGSD